MASQSISRKRPVPGSNPVGFSQPMPAQIPQQMPQQLQQQQQPSMYPTDAGQNLSDEQFLQWGNSAQPPVPFDNNTAYGLNSNTFSQPMNQPTNQIARRPVAENPARAKPEITWSEQQNGSVPPLDSAWSDDIEDLEAKAQVAKKDAQAKRKQIPPFVQKLNSFLENGKNTELIRWADDGNSFIVVDEDEFAKTLIPELFKHNNYASFVRQLNMYGFHKKVGLSDNSMRASERKNKSPSEYSNPYFRRGHPDLLWLISKPKMDNTRKKGKKLDNDLIDEDFDDLDPEIKPSDKIRPRPQLALGYGENMLSQEQFETIHRELSTIKHQQAQIQRAMTSLKREHEALYGQAASFQDQHSRHENSINAILTFLATVYNRSLQGHEGVQGIQNLFTNSIPHDNQSGTVVDVGDYNFDNFDSLDTAEPSPNKLFKKQQLLLTDGQQAGRASTLSPSTASNTPFPPRQARRPSQTYRTAQASQPAVEEVFDSTMNTPQPTSYDANPPQHDMMSVIQNTNARNSSPNNVDFSNVLSSLENAPGQAPLTNSQRADMLRMINSSSGNLQGGDNALVNSTPPPMPSNFDRQLALNKSSFDALAKMQAEQDKNVQNLTNLLQPLSPTGSIPGIHDDTNIPAPDWDVDEFLADGNDYFTDLNTAPTPEEIQNFNDYKRRIRALNVSDPSTTELNNVYAVNNNSAVSFPDFDTDEMFVGIQPTTGPGLKTNDPKLDNDHLTADAAAEDARGRVESASIASSEAHTPRSDNGQRPTHSWGRHGRNLSTVEDDQSDQPAKRRRKG